jgi:hypothetical protein
MNKAAFTRHYPNWADANTSVGETRYLKNKAKIRAYVLAMLVEALRNKPVGRGFDSQLGHWVFIDIIPPAAL